MVMVDVEDTDEVVDTFIERLLELQLVDQLPIYVIPILPTYKVIQQSQPTHASGIRRARALP